MFMYNYMSLYTKSRASRCSYTLTKVEKGSRCSYTRTTTEKTREPLESGMQVDAAPH